MAHYDRHAKAAQICPNLGVSAILLNRKYIGKMFDKISTIFFPLITFICLAPLIFVSNICLAYQMKEPKM